MNKHEKMKRNEQIKETLKKILHVVSYVLSVAFIVLMVIVGAQSCSNNKNNVATENKPLKSHLRVRNAVKLDDLINYNVYTFKFGSHFDMTLDDLASFEYGIDPYTTFATQQSDLYINVTENYSNVGYAYYQGEIYSLNYFFLVYSTYEIENGDYAYRINYGQLRLFNGVDYLNGAYFYKDNTDGESLSYTSVNIDASLLFYEEVVPNIGFNYFYKLNNNPHFIFNKDFNYNAPIGLSIDNYYGGDVSLAPITIAGGIYRYKYETGYFISNNVLYNGIVVDYLNSGACHYLINSLLTLGQSGSLSYNALGFVRVDNGLIDFVNYRNTSQHMVSGGSPTTYYLNSSTWINDAFRKVTFLQDLSESLNVKINAFNNNNQNTIDGYIGSGQITDVFTLVGSVFTSILPVLNIMVLPGITLGILMFIPLVAMLVFAIIRIIKK